MQQNIIISIISDRHLASQGLIEALEDNGAESITSFDEDEIQPEDSNEHTEMIYRGIMTDENGKITIRYDDCEMNDGKYSTPTAITFDRGEPDLVTMVREGAFSTSLTFKPHKRHICIYSIMFTEIQLTVHTVNVVNSVFDTGRLSLDYIIEILGAQTERTRLEMSIKKAPDDISLQ